MAISKLNGAPFSNISEWIYEKEETSAPNPMKPWKKETVKKKKMNVSNMQQVFAGLVQKVNQIIDELGGHTSAQYMTTTIPQQGPHGHIGTGGGSTGGKFKKGGLTEEQRKRDLIEQIKRLQ